MWINLATAIRTIVILIIAWGIVFATPASIQWASLSSRTLIFLGLSGIATGLSWIFYFHALQKGDASLVAPIDKSSLVLTLILCAVFLGESLSWKVILGCSLIIAGTLVIIL